MKKEIEKHRKIELNTKTSLKLYLWNLCSCLEAKKNSQIKKLQRLYQAGEERLEEELNIVKIIKNLKNLRILTKNKFIDPKTQVLINHDIKNIINLDESSDGEQKKDDAMSSCESHGGEAAKDIFTEFKKQK